MQTNTKKNLTVIFSVGAVVGVIWMLVNAYRCHGKPPNAPAEQTQILAQQTQTLSNGATVQGWWIRRIGETSGHKAYLITVTDEIHGIVCYGFLNEHAISCVPMRSNQSVH